MTLADLATIDATGYHFADYPTYLAYFQDQYRAIYGADVYLEADSQDGQWVAIQAKAAYDTAVQGAASYNSFKPTDAQGVGLSRLVKINGLTRQSASKSTVELVVVGQAGIPITAGVATDNLNQKWNLPSLIIPDSGTITVTAESDVEGAIAAAANTITTIFTPTLGWQTVNNPAEATPGAPVETDAVLRVRQTVSTADPSLTVFDGTIGGVSNLPGVLKVRGYENDTNSTDGNTIPPHSISVVVLGGTDQAIGDEIALHKTPGTGTYGLTDVPVVDAHGMPLVIHFNRAVAVTIQVELTISVNTSWSNDYIALIQDSLAAVINAIRIGDPILITKLYVPAYLTGTPAGQTFDIATLEIGRDGGMTGTSNIVLGYKENPTCDPTTDITVNIT